MTARRCTGAIIAGGTASRLGGIPKGLLEVGGRRIVDRVADALRAECDDLLVVANHEDASSWVAGARTTRDLRPGLGALGGIHAALASSDGDVVAVAWDMPFVTPALVRALRTASGAADAVVPAQPESRSGFNPLCAWYAHECLGAIERAIDAGDLRAAGWLDAVRVARLDRDALRRIGEPGALLFDVDTEQDLAAARTMAEHAA